MFVMLQTLIYWGVVSSLPIIPKPKVTFQFALPFIPRLGFQGAVGMTNNELLKQFGFSEINPVRFGSWSF